MTDYIAPYIPESKYVCRCCGALPPDLYDDPVYEYLFGKYKLVCDLYGDEPIISSGYRCAKHNAEVGGSQLSVHMFGLAIDVDLSSIEEVDRFANAVDSVYPVFRMGIYKLSGSFVHLDIGYRIEPRATEKWAEGARWYK